MYLKYLKLATKKVIKTLIEQCKYDATIPVNAERLVKLSEQILSRHLGHQISLKICLVDPTKNGPHPKRVDGAFCPGDLSKLYVNILLDETHQRFVTCHELMHAYMHYLQHQIISDGFDFFENTQAEEIICCILTGILLCPTTELKVVLREKNKFSPTDSDLIKMKKLANYFGVPTICFLEYLKYIFKKETIKEVFGQFS